MSTIIILISQSLPRTQASALRFNNLEPSTKTDYSVASAAAQPPRSIGPVTPVAQHNLRRPSAPPAVIRYH